MESIEAFPLQPDWVYRPDVNLFTWREHQGRPPIELEINRVHHSAWKLFSKHHYLTADLNHAAVCFCAFWQGKPVAFDAWLPFFGKLKDNRPARRGHRTVCLPDYQGVGIGNALFTFAASLWAGLGYRAFSNTGHPAEMNARARNPNWRMTRAPSQSSRDGGRSAALQVVRERFTKSRATSRLTASFEYVGPPLSRERASMILDTWATCSL